MPIIPKSRQTIVVSVICLLVVLVTLVIVYGFPSKKAVSDKVVADISNSSASQSLSTSTDWQKSFYEVSGTSTKAYDTSISSANSASTTEVLTSTDVLGRSFLTIFSQIHQAGLDTDAQTVNNVANKLATNSLASANTPKIYYENDIHVVADSAMNSNAYAKALGAILANSLPSENEATIADEAFQKNDMTLLQRIDPVLTGYNKTVSSLLSVTVPESASPYHIDLINGFSMEIHNAQALRHVDSDPVLGLAAVGQELPALQRISTALGNLQRYFNANNITFVAPNIGQ